METCCESLVKYFINNMIMNIILALIGLILIGFGYYAHFEAKEYVNFFGENTPVLLIALGISLRTSQ